ncbi:MAG: hypothetical protein CMI18_01395 [Opitutaceae bacterium]|nr:hypothetical protein [Opitutaceae bacterium]
MKFISILALLLSFGAIGTILYQDFAKPEIAMTPDRQDGETYSKAEPETNVKDELLRIKLRLSALEKAIDNKTREIEPIPQIQEEVAELSNLQNDLVEYALNIDPLDVIGAQEREIEEAYNTLLDESKSAGLRARQAVLLKRYNMFDEEAVQAMTDLFHNSEQLNGKALALAALKGYETKEIQDSVLESLSLDVANGYKSARFRYFGIEALEPLLPNSEVEAMLNQIAENDPEIKIANRAAKTVGLPASQNDKNKRKDRARDDG